MAPGAQAAEQELLAWCREHLAAHQVPAFVIFTDHLPRNPVGKLIRPPTSLNGWAFGPVPGGAPPSTWSWAGGRENRSQIVFTKARGRDAVFWQSPRTRKQARPNVTTPAGRAAGIAELQITVDSHERYAYRFTGRPVVTVKRALPCGDYGLAAGGRLIASVERKSMADLVASLTGGKLRYALAELAALPRAAVVVEDR